MSGSGERRTGRAGGAGLAAAALCFVIVGLFDDGLPFYFEDLEILDAARARSWGQLGLELLDPRHVGDRIGYRAQERPLGLLYLKSIHALVGLRPSLIRLPELVALASMTGLLAAAVARVTGGVWLAVLLGLGIGACPSIQQSALWICDFEPMAACFAAVALLLWTRLLAAPAGDPQWGRLAAIAVITYFGVKMKPGAFVVAPALVLSSLLLGRRRLREATAAAVILAAVIVPPRIGGIGDVGVDPGLWDNVARLAPMSVRICALGWVGVLGLTVVLLRSRRRGAEGSASTDLAAVLAGWGLCAAALWAVLPAAEGRYLAGFAAPALAAAHLAGAMLVRRHWGTHRAVVGAVVGVGLATLLPANLARDAAFRGSWGSVFIAMDQAAADVEERMPNTAVVYRYWRPMLYPRYPERGTEFIWQDRADALMRGIQFLPNGDVRFPPRFTKVVRLSIVGVPRGVRPGVLSYPGTGGRWFDRMVAGTGWRIRNIDLVTLRLDDTGGPYPVTAIVEPWGRR